MLPLPTLPTLNCACCEVIANLVFQHLYQNPNAASWVGRIASFVVKGEHLIA